MEAEAQRTRDLARVVVGEKARALNAGESALGQTLPSLVDSERNQLRRWLVPAAIVFGLPTLVVTSLVLDREGDGLRIACVCAAVLCGAAWLRSRSNRRNRCPHGIPFGGRDVECAGCRQYLAERVTHARTEVAALQADLERKERELDFVTKRERAYRLAGLQRVEQLLALPPVEFERTVAEVLATEGFAVRMTRLSGDRGVDVVAQRQGVCMVVQCKRYSAKSGVGIEEVQRMIGAMLQEKAQRCMIATTSYFTKEARVAATSLGVWIVDGEGLMEVLSGRRRLGDGW